MGYREDYIAGLRQLADYLEERPDVPVPISEKHYAFVHDEDTFRKAARSMGSAKKDFDINYAMLRRDFAGGIHYELNIARERVCERRVVATKAVPEQVIPAHEVEVVEWDCKEPLLAHDSAPVESNS